VSETVLLTGATGFLGMELLARLIERDGVSVLCLVRADSDDAAQARLAEVVGRLYDEPPAGAADVRAVAGDVSKPDLGLSAAGRAQLRTESAVWRSYAAAVSKVLSPA